MSAASAEIIYPCPITTTYGIPYQQAWWLLKIYSIYRLILSILFVLLFYFIYHSKTLPGGSDQQLYQFSSYIYLAISLLTTPFILVEALNYPRTAQVLIFTDIVFITLLMHASGGINSGIGILLTISIAAGGLLIGGRCAMLFAALASIAVLGEQIYDIEAFNFNGGTLSYSGMLGVSFFSIVLLSYMLTERSKQSDKLEKQHSITIARLEELNRYIIQHMQSGIMITDEQQNIQLSNQSALRLLGLIDFPDRLDAITGDLQQTFQQWRKDSTKNFAVIHLDNGKEIQIRFSLLNIHHECLNMMIFEDMALYNQRLQQSKLASLGRLTASIAHEIRNPLSSISHASQLLSEASNLQTQDLRLIEIIQKNSQRVNRIIQDILKLSKRNPLQKQRINLDLWLPVYLEELSQSFKEYSGNFKLNFIAHDLNAYIDAGHLKQILDNLCTNALRYGRPDRGKILLEADRLHEAPCIRVIDNGPGISITDLQLLFEPFFTTSHQGTGLGLYISRELAELNQAELSYTPQAGKACFTLTLVNADLAVIEL
jgi:two-component system sensor histidine kinase PilS (NtrC family)